MTDPNGDRGPDEDTSPTTDGTDGNHATPESADRDHTDESSGDGPPTADQSDRGEPRTDDRVSTGIAEPDTVLGGGLFPGRSYLPVGDTGTGTTLVALSCSRPPRNRSTRPRISSSSPTATSCCAGWREGDDSPRRSSGDRTPDRATDGRISHLTDNLVFLRHLESDGGLRRTIGVLEKRTSDFEYTLRKFRITDRGVEAGEPLTGLRGVLSGTPECVD